MMQLKLQISNIKEFLQFASEIKSDSSAILPILRFIKVKIDFGECTMTKTNTNSFCIYKFDTPQVSDDIEFIIPEKELSDFINVCPKNQWMYIEIGEKNTHSISEQDGGKKGYVKKYNDEGYKMIDFPQSGISIDGIDYSKINKPQIESLFRAKNYAADDALQPSLTHIYICDVKEKCYIVALSQNTFYTELQNESFSCLALSKDQCATINKFDYVEYCCNPNDSNFNVFKIGSQCIYGFKNIEDLKPPTVWCENIFNVFERKNYFSIKTEELIKFCTSVKLYNNTNDKRKEEAKWLNSKLGVGVNNFAPSGYNAICNIIFDMEAKVGESILHSCDINLFGNGFEFEFNQTQFLEILKTLPYEEICLCDFKSAIFLFSEKDDKFLGFISKIVPQIKG